MATPATPPKPTAAASSATTRKRSIDKVRLDRARPADPRRQGTERLEGGADVAGPERLSRQLLLALPRYCLCRFPIPGAAKLAGSHDRPGHPGRCWQSRARPSEASAEACLRREARFGPRDQVVGRGGCRVAAIVAWVDAARVAYIANCCCGGNSKPTRAASGSFHVLGLSGSDYVHGPPPCVDSSIGPR